MPTLANPFFSNDTSPISPSASYKTNITCQRLLPLYSNLQMEITWIRFDTDWFITGKRN